MDQIPEREGILATEVVEAEAGPDCSSEAGANRQ